MRHAHAPVVAHLADNYRVQIPFAKDVGDFALSTFVGDDQHSLL